MEILFNSQTLMIFIVAVVFTVVGQFWGKRDEVEKIVASTVDSLIADGYLKTRGTGSSMEILKHEEWCKKDVDI
jgi:hypothetical protein